MKSGAYKPINERGIWMIDETLRQLYGESLETYPLGRNTILRTDLTSSKIVIFSDRGEDLVKASEVLQELTNVKLTRIKKHGN